MGCHSHFFLSKEIFFFNMEILSFARTWINMEDIMLSEISQTEKHKHCMWNYKHLKVIFFLRYKKIRSNSIN